jgi:hypothetical protein
MDTIHVVILLYLCVLLDRIQQILIEGIYYMGYRSLELILFIYI